MKMDDGGHWYSQKTMDAVVKEREELREKLETVLRLDQAWPLKDILTKLADGADHTLNVHNCDHEGYEEFCAARDAARMLLADLNAEGKDGCT